MQFGFIIILTSIVLSFKITETLSRLSDLWEDDMSEEECDFPSVQMFLTAVGTKLYIISCEATL